MKALSSASLTLALLLVGCQSAPAATPGPPTPTPAPTRVVVSAECAEDLAPLYDALTELNSRLSVGMNLNSYGEHVGNIRVAYDRVDAGMDMTCLELAMVPMEAAFGKYVEAYNSWNGCLGNTACTMDERQPTLQRFWTEASEEIDKARRPLP